MIFKAKVLGMVAKNLVRIGEEGCRRCIQPWWHGGQKMEDAMERELIERQKQFEARKS